MSRGFRKPATHVLERGHLDRARYDALWEERFAHRPQEVRVYLNVHRERYFELFNALAHLLRGREHGAQVLEVGVSEYMSLYKGLFPTIRLASLDRPLTLSGVDPELARTMGAERHYNVDLNQQGLSPDIGEPSLGRFDVIVCSEVIEHLVLNPVEFLQGLMSLLQPQGLLYLTTPNFLRAENLLKIERGENPQPPFPRRGENWDAHHHFHEFTMSELLQCIEQAGGRVVHRYFSACWDGPEVRDGPVERRANIVVVAGREEAPPAQA